jgi:hypothetical protein
MSNVFIGDTGSPARPSTEAESEFRSPKKLQLQFFVLRFALYLLWVAALFQGVVFFVRRLGWERIIPENHLIELAQIGFLFLTFCNLVALAIRYPRTRGLYVFLSCLTGMAIIRECDYTSWYEHLIGWQEWVVGLSLLAVVIISFRRVFVQQVRAFLRRPSVIVFVLGFMLIVTWAQVLGQRELFTDSRVDRLVEELLELAGYFLIFMGVIEEWIAQWQGRAYHDSPAHG